MTILVLPGLFRWDRRMMHSCNYNHGNKLGRMKQAWNLGPTTQTMVNSKAIMCRSGLPPRASPTNSLLPIHLPTLDTLSVCIIHFWQKQEWCVSMLICPLFSRISFISLLPTSMPSLPHILSKGKLLGKCGSAVNQAIHTCMKSDVKPMYWSSTDTTWRPMSSQLSAH